MTDDTANDGKSIVHAFLAAMEARDLETARRFLAPGFEMVFPGAEPMHTLEELIAWSKPRYNRVGKIYDRFDEAPGDDCSSIVYCFGHLHGEWLDGSEFAGIRFIDRFTIRDGLLVDQKVWNDMGEVRLAALGGE